MNQSGDGFLNKVFDEIFARSGLSYRFVSTPGARALVGANDGTYDGDAARTVSAVKKFPNLVTVPEPVITVVFAGVSLGKRLVLRTPEDFRNYSVGYIRGWEIAEHLFSDYENIEVLRSPDLLMNMLAQGRIDVAFLTLAPAFHIARTADQTTGQDPRLTDLKISEFRVHHDLYIHLNRQHADLVPVLANALKSMKADGRYDEIMDGYSPEEH